MQGSLCTRAGVLYVGTEEETAHLSAWDFDGHELEARFDFGGGEEGPASAAGLYADEDHRLWVADSVAARLRSFTLFGREIAHVDRELLPDLDLGGLIGTPVDVLSAGSDDEQELLVASAGVRRHAVQWLPLAGGASRSLRPLGDPAGLFHGVRRVEHAVGLTYVVETGARRVQVFRGEDFHFQFALEVRGGAFLPMALRALADGRLLLAQGGERSALLLLSSTGRLIKTLAGHGEFSGQVFEPSGLAVDPGRDDRHTRCAVIDRDGCRIQVFNLEGRCYGSFPSFGLSDRMEG